MTVLIQKLSKIKIDLKSCTERPAIVSYPVSIHIPALIMYLGLKEF